MNNRNINGIISIASVVIMIIWGTLAGSYRHAWIAVFIGGALIACLSLYNKGKADTNKAADKADTNKSETVKAGADDGRDGNEENDQAKK